jgi:flagella basal body P-ring formation protein FlgA
MTVRLALSFLLCATVLAMDAVEGLQVILQEHAIVTDSRVLLGDIAALDGDPVLVSAASGLTVRRLPGVGSWIVDARAVRALVRRQLGADASVDGSATVVREAEVVTATRIEEAAMAHLMTRRDDREVDVSILRHPVALSVPAAESPVSLEAEPLSAAWWGQVPYRVRLMRGDVEVGRTLVVFRVNSWREVPVAARDLSRGHTLSLQDFAMRRVRVRAGQGDDADAVSPEDLAGWVLQCAVAAGTPIDRVAAKPLPDVERGSTVVVVYKGTSFDLTTHGEALTAGRTGDRIQVRVNDGRVVEGSVAGVNRVVITPD